MPEPEDRIHEQVLEALNAVSAGFAAITERDGALGLALVGPHRRLQRALEALEKELPPKTDWLRADVQHMLDELDEP